MGKIAEIPQNAKPGIINQALLRIRLRENIIIKKFFLYVFRSASFQRNIFDQSQGTAMSNLIGVKDFKEVKIPLPPLAEQHRIVAKIEELFSSLDNGIQNLKTAQQQLKIYRQAVLKWAFSGQFVSQDSNNEPVSFSLSQTESNFMNEEKFLPKGWENAELKNVIIKANKVKSKEKSQNEGFIYIDIGSIDNVLNKITSYKTYKWENAPSRAQQIVEVGDTLFSTVRTYLKNIAFVDKEIYHHQIASSGFTVIRANRDKIIPKYLFYYSLFSDFINQLNKLQTGTSYPAVRDNDVFSQRINYPKNIQEQQAIVAEIESRLSVCDKLEETIQTSLKQAEILRQSILKKAFSGQLVPQNPNDEPASLLLEKIQGDRAKNNPKTRSPKSSKKNN